MPKKKYDWERPAIRKKKKPLLGDYSTTNAPQNREEKFAWMRGRRALITHLNYFGGYRRITKEKLRQFIENGRHHGRKLSVI